MKVHKQIVCIGIDWADEEHAFHIIADDGETASGVFEQNPAAIDAWLAGLRRQFPHSELSICLEQSRGALIVGLMKHVDLQIYPINPGQLASYRKSMNYGGCKDDPSDAELLAQFLMNYRSGMRALTPDTPQTRKLALLTEHRRSLVEQRTRLANQLTAVLKQYFPLLVEFKPAKPYARFLCRLLIKWPSLARLKRARPGTIRRFLHKLNIRGARIEDRIAMIRDAVALTSDQVLIECFSMRAVCIARNLLLLSDAIDQYDQSIEAQLSEHEDREIFASLPGAARLTQSRMIAALGTDRDRFKDAQALQACSGIAPVTKQSGRTRTVHHRWACTTFMKQTFHEFAGLSIAHSSWARAYYRMLLSRGKKPNVAKRALAYKWQRIIFRCWKDRTPCATCRDSKKQDHRSSNTSPRKRPIKIQNKNT